MQLLPVVLLLLATRLLEATAGQHDRWPMTEPITQAASASGSAQPGFYVLRSPARYDSVQHAAGTEPLTSGASIRQWSNSFPATTQPLTSSDQYHQTKPSASAQQSSQTTPAKWKYSGSSNGWERQANGGNGQAGETERFEVTKVNGRPHRKPASSSRSRAASGWKLAGATSSSKPKRILVIDAGYTTGNIQDDFLNGWPMSKPNGNGWQMAASNAGWQEAASSSGWQGADSNGWQASSNADSGWQMSGNDEQVYTVKTANLHSASAMETDSGPFFSGAGPMSNHGHAAPEKHVYIVKTISHSPSEAMMAQKWPSDGWSDSPMKWPSDGWNGAMMDMPMEPQMAQSGGGLGQELLALLGKKHEFILKALPSLLPSAKQSAPAGWPSDAEKPSKKDHWA